MGSGVFDVRKDGDRWNVEQLGGSDNPQRDLSSVRDQELVRVRHEDGAVPK